MKQVNYIEKAIEINPIELIWAMEFLFLRKLQGRKNIQLFNFQMHNLTPFLPTSWTTSRELFNALLGVNLMSIFSTHTLFLADERVLFKRVWLPRDSSSLTLCDQYNHFGANFWWDNNIDLDQLKIQYAGNVVQLIRSGWIF